MFKKLYRILMMAVIAVAAFFVISSLSLSNRLNEGESIIQHLDVISGLTIANGPADYAPRNWRYRWILLDASLAMIYLVVFAAIAWLWRPVRANCAFLCHPY
jgi:hypothetical protein